MSVLDQLPLSTLSLQGNGFNPQQNQPAWGYQRTDGIAQVPLDLDPADSNLHLLYSIYTDPNVRLVDFNKNGQSKVKGESILDELDPNAPANTMAGLIGSVTSQIYKSVSGRKYSDLGPQPGRY